MRWQDKGYLLTLNKYNENSAIAEFFTENNGKISGLIFGATSKKIKNYLLIGNKFHLDFNFKQDYKLGYFKVEIEEINTPLYLENKKKLFCIIYTMNIIKILTVENQVNKTIYQLLDNFFVLLDNDNWLINFIFWELNFYKCIGYAIDLFSENSRQIEIWELDRKLLSGHLPEKYNEVIMNDKLSSSLHLSLGDKVTFIGSTMDGAFTTFNYTLVGTFSLNIGGTDKNMMILDISGKNWD